MEETVKNGAATEEVADTKDKKKKQKPQERIEELEALLKEKEDRILRLAAEYDNFRRRAREERLAAYESSVADTVAAFLPLVDNLERAQMFDDADKVREGLVMIAKSVEGVFTSLGIEEVGKPGDGFDPNLHNAVMHIDDEAFGENEIVEVFQKGYKKGAKIIRFAMVKTAN